MVDERSPIVGDYLTDWGFNIAQLLLSGGLAAIEGMPDL